MKFSDTPEFTSARRSRDRSPPAADDHERRRSGDGALGVGAVGGPGDLADVVARRGRVVHRDVGLGVVAVVLGDPVVGGVVDHEARARDAVVERGAVVGVNGARTGAAVDGVGGVAADEGDLGARRQREGVVVVLEKDDALALDLDDDVLGVLGGRAATTVLLVVVGGVPVLGARRVGDGGLAAAHVVVERRLEHVGAHVGGDGHAHEGAGAHAARDKAATCHLLRLLLWLVSHGNSSLFGYPDPLI